jgi:hypothetical protein
MPCVATVFNWLRLHAEFLEQYTRAREEQADALAEDMLDIADDGTNDWMAKLGPGEICAKTFAFEVAPTVRSEDKVAVIALSLGQERNDMLRGSPNNVTLSVTCAVQ